MSMATTPATQPHKGNQKAHPSTLTDGPLGIPPQDTHPALQTDIFKELINKLAWALGSTYRQQYRNKTAPARVYALRMATRVIRDHGYPYQIALPGLERK